MAEHVVVTLTSVLLCVSLAGATPSGQGPSTPPSQPSFPTQPFVFEELRQSSRLEDNGTGRTEGVMRVRVQNDAGVQHWGQLTLPYASASQDLKVVVFEVHKPDGTVVRGDPSAIEDVGAQPLAGLKVFQDFRQKHLTVPALKAGDVLVLRLLWTTHTPMVQGHFFFQHDFTKDIVVLDERLEVDVPSTRPITIALSPDAPREQTQLKGTLENGRRIYRWQTSQLKLLEPSTEEKKATEDEESKQPDVRLSTFGTWDDVGRWYAGLAGPAAKVDTQVRARADSLLKGLTTEEERIRAVYEYVSAEIRYVSLSFGAGRYAPHAAGSVLANQYGDCKDKHTLLAALLRAAGIESWAVLANSTRRVDPRMPSPLEFDHLFTVVPRGASPDDWLWLDTTPGVAPFRMLSPGLRNKEALVVPVHADAEKPSTPTARLITTPANPPFATHTTLEVEGRINALGVLDARVRNSMRGDAELIFRSVLRGLAEDKWNEFARGAAEGIGFKDSKVTDAKIINLLTTREPLVIEYTVRDPGQLTWTKSGATLALPMAPFTFAAASANDWEGRKRLELGAPGTITVRASLELPAGYTARMPVAVSVTRDALEYESQYRVAERKLHVERRLRTRAAELSAAASGEYLAFVRAVRADEAQRVEVTFDTQALPDIPADATAAELYRAGDAAYDSSNFKVAEMFFKRTVEVDPKHADAWVSLGLAYEQMERLTDAKAAMLKSIEISPFHSQAHKDLARVLEDLDDLEAARNALLKHVDIHPLDGRALGDLGSLLVDMDQYSEAVPYLEKAASLVKDDAWVTAHLGVSYLEGKAYDKARPRLEEAVRISPTPAIWTYVAWNLAEHGQNLSRAAELAQKTLTHAAVVLQKVDAAAVDADDFDLVERIAWSWDALGWIRYQQGDLPGAERYLKAAWLLSAEHDTVYRLAQVYEKSGKTTDAATAFLTSVVMEPKAGTDARERLKKYFGPGSDMDSAGNGAKTAMVQERAVRMPSGAPSGEARFGALMKPDGSLADISFISGSDTLRSKAETLAKVQLPLRFPDATVSRLPIHITVWCGGLEKACYAANVPARIARKAS